MAKSPVYPRPLSIGLALSQPTATDPGSEVAAPGYARQVVPFDFAATPDTLTNTASVVFPRAASLWGVVGWLTAWELDGAYAGYGNLVSISDGGVTSPAQVRIARGDVARFAVGALLATDRNGPSLYGVGPYGVGLYSAGERSPPRPFGRGRYSAGPYSRNPHALKLTGLMSRAFTDEALCCPNAAAWTPEICIPGSWTESAGCSAPAWTLEALP